MRKINSHTIVNLILSFVTGFIFLNSYAGNRLICDYCKKAITNPNYVWVEDKYFHSNHFFCHNCKESLVDRKFYSQDDNYYCEKCYDSLFVLRCTYCNKQIIGKYIKYDQEIYHEECYYDNIAVKCDFCGEYIVGEYDIDCWGNKYHPEHKKDNPKCEYCGRLISDNFSQGGSKYHDGRVICELCDDNTIFDPKEGKEIMILVAEGLNNYGIKIKPKKIKLHLVDKDELRRIAVDADERHLQGYTTYEAMTMYGIRVAKKFNIYILNGLPEIYFKSTMAHELMHVWLFGNARLEMEAGLTEGSCNYATYLVLNGQKDEMTNYLLECMEQDKHPYYGDGYRRVKTYVKQVGIQEWLSCLKSNIEFPSEY